MINAINGAGLGLTASFTTAAAAGMRGATALTDTGIEISGSVGSGVNPTSGSYTGTLSLAGAADGDTLDWLHHPPGRHEPCDHDHHGRSSSGLERTQRHPWMAWFLTSTNRLQRQRIRSLRSRCLGLRRGSDTNQRSTCNDLSVTPYSALNVSADLT